MTDQTLKDIDRAFKALEERDELLDKIRAEIVELQKEYKEYGWVYDDALEVIDKYKTESEDGMTREEKIENLLTELIDMIDNGSQRDLDRADEIGTSIIKLLEQEPRYCDRNICLRNECNGIGCDECEATKSQESCEDAISREAVLEKAVYTETEEGWSGYTVDVEYIKSLPSVKPQEPKTGHWIEHPETETSAPEYLMFYECSECGDKQCFCKSDIYKKHFCNNCGARMVEPQESEEV